MSQLTRIVHPSAWYSRDIPNRPEWSQRLSSEEIDELLTVAAAIDFDRQRPIEYDDGAPSLPILGRRLQRVQHDLEHGSGVIRLLGFPADEVPEDLAMRAMWVIGRSIGTPISQSAAGERLFSVRDSGLANNDAKARGPNTRKKLSFHTDRCDVIGFMCFRQALSGGANDIVSSATLFNELLADRPELVEVLMQPYLYKRHNVDLGNELPYVQQPVFTFREGHFAANLLRVLIERAYAMEEAPEMTALQREALDVLEERAEDSELRFSFRQEHGDILFLNNFVTLHRRGEFVDHAEPDKKRHLFRIWLSMPNSRPLDPRFAGNYGATEAGAIRGGMTPQ